MKVDERDLKVLELKAAAVLHAQVFWAEIASLEEHPTGYEDDHGRFWFSIPLPRIVTYSSGIALGESYLRMWGADRIET